MNQEPADDGERSEIIRIDHLLENESSEHSDKFMTSDQDSIDDLARNIATEIPSFRSVGVENNGGIQTLDQ